MRNILVIEDDEIMLKAIRNILNKDGFNVVIAKDGKEAFEKVQAMDYDLVITDLMMPYANGLEIVSRIRNDEAKNNIGIIIISSVGNEDTITEAFRLGADDYLKKPIMAGELLIRIRRLLDEKSKSNKAFSASRAAVVNSSTEAQDDEVLKRARAPRKKTTE